MNHKIKDGIVIDSTIYMMDGKKKGFPLLLRFMQLFFLMAGSYSIISIFIEAFFLQVNGSHIQMTVFIASIILFILILYPEYDWVKFGVAVTIYLILLRKFFEQLQNGFYLLENAILEQTADYYNFTVIKYRAQYSTAEEDMTILMIMILVPLIALLAYSLIRCGWINITNIITILPVAASFAVGITPSEGYLITYLLTILFLSRSYGLGRTSSYKEQKFMVHRINSRAAFLLSLITLGLFLVMKLMISEDKYDEVSGVREVKMEIQDFMMNFSLEEVSERISEIRWLPKKSNIGSGGLNSGKLGRVDQVSYEETEQLRLTVPLKSITEGIYLKGYVGSVYTGDSWEKHSSATKKKYEKLSKSLLDNDFEPVNQTVSLLKRIRDLKQESLFWITSDMRSFNQQKYEFMKSKIHIEYTGANKKFIYAPYLTDFNSSNLANYEQDLYAAPKTSEDKYSFEYFFNLNINEELSGYLSLYQTDLDELSAAEILYRDFVYDTYIQLPKNGLSRLKDEFNREKIGVRVDNIQKAISYIKDYLHSNTSYTLSPGKLPKDEDFVEYFLYENKVGYCSHYASAGVMMLRALGYPARYVEGYVITATDVLYTKPMSYEKVTVYSDRMDSEALETQVEVSVKDYSAHAWVEVYMDGFGWFPVEFTPSAGLDNTEEIIGDVGGVSEEIMREEANRSTPTPMPIEPTQVPSEPEEIDTSKDPKATEEKKEAENPSGSEEGEDTSYGTWNLIIILTIMLIGIIVAIMLILQRKKINYMDNHSKKAILIYKEMERLFISLNALPKKSHCLEDHLEYVRTNCQYINTEHFDSVIETVKKARFGRNVITKEEFDEVKNFYRQLSATAYQQLSPWKRFFLRMKLS